MAAHNRCWTADRLARRGLPHPDRCPLCDQEEENIQHLLVGCVFARHFWLELLQFFGLATLAPQLDEPSFDVWWDRSALMVSADMRKGLNSLLILGTSTIWKVRNDCVFNGATPSITTALAHAREEAN